MIIAMCGNEAVTVINNKNVLLEYVQQKAYKIKKSITKIESDEEHVKLVCPMSNSVIEVRTTDEGVIEWLDAYLKADGWYAQT